MGSNKRDKVLTIQEEAHLKAVVFDLPEKGAKQLLYGIIKIMAMSGHIVTEKFEEILDDARKYGEAIKTR